jgi:hypothetical protein
MIKNVILILLFFIATTSYSQIITYETIQKREYDIQSKKILKDSIFAQHGKIVISKDKKIITQEEGNNRWEFKLIDYNKEQNLYYYYIDGEPNPYALSLALHPTGHIIIAWDKNEYTIYLVKIQIVTYKEI